MNVDLDVKYENGYVVEINFKKGDFNVENEAEKQLLEYLNGHRKTLSFPYKIKGTAFQKKVYETLMTSEYGSTITYKSLAEKAGHDKAYRAVGSAMNKNPLAILIPCHRVLPSDYSLGKFGASVSIKKTLLDLERSVKKRSE